MDRPFLPQSMSDSIVDLSHWNNVSQNFTATAESGIVAVVLKATQGTGFVDPTFLERTAAARVAGLLVGAYHFLDSSDPAQQMTQFLTTAVTMANVNWLALDFEPYPPSSPTVSTAAGAASILHTRMGRWPVLYTIRGMLPSSSDTLSNCPLWLAEYGTNPVLPPGWTGWKLWQHTDGRVGSGVVPVPGIGACDRSRFAGTVPQLRQWWRNPV